MAVLIRAMSDASDHLLAWSGGCRSAIMQEHAFGLLAQAGVPLVPMAVEGLVRSRRRDVARSSAILQNRCHLLVEKLVLMVDLILPFLFHPVLSTRGFQKLAKLGLVALVL